MTLLEQLKNEYRSILDKCSTENRGYTADEKTRVQTLKAEIEAFENHEKDKASAVAAAVTERNEQLRSLAAAQAATGTLPQQKSGSNEYYRSLAKGAVDVGNKDVVADVVRQYQQTSPIFAAHNNVQSRSTGNTFSFTKIVPDTTKGYIKAEGNAGRDDTTTTLAIVPVAYKLYDSEKVLITQELLDDASVNLGMEITTAGLAKSAAAFGRDLVTTLMSAVATPAETSGAGWTITDLANTYFGIPLRNRTGLKYCMNSKTASQIVELLGVEAGPRLAAIGLTADALLIDEGIADDTIILANITTALAIGQKVPVRVLVLDISEGKTFEIQPRFAVALRDGGAVAIIKKKAA